MSMTKRISVIYSSVANHKPIVVRIIFDTLFYETTNPHHITQSLATYFISLDNSNWSWSTQIK